MSVDKDISLKELIIKVSGYLGLYKSKWKSIIAGAILLALLSLVLNWGKSKSYTSTLTFMLNVDERGFSGGLSSVLGQIGLGGIAGSESNLDKILKLSKARIITEKAVFEKTEIDGQEDYLANHIINLLENDGKWQRKGLLSLSTDSLSLEGFRFEHDSLEVFSAIENKALKSLHNKIVGSKDDKAMFTSEYDELTGIMTLNVQTGSETLSIDLINTLFQELGDYYIEKSTEKQQYEYDILKEKYDSINYVLRNVQVNLANIEDGNKAVFRKRDVLEKNRLKVEEQKLQFIMGKAEEQVQLAKIALDNKTPYIQLIDKPLSPIKPDNKSLLFYLLFGAMAGAIIVILFWSVKKAYKDIMQQEN